ncbi:hypothetical protein PMAYCL1PPCAC_25868 [Pristionchus mayeri]|uniref:YEATS domain-containing protein n=1 Tax=Pristionchus mayeri TaxID=1317129 RepID=A0AAN5D345_9BILA|nr:hypothetical protein PMAYCL1PPCAC_25868 [Pristionchus mayeri]
MGPNGRLLVRLKVGHTSEVLQPPLPNGHTHRWTVFVKSFDSEDFKDRSFVEKVIFNIHVDFPNPKRVVKDPPFEVTETGYAGFTIPISIFLANKVQYKVQYDLNLTFEPTAFYTTPTTISVNEYTPEFYTIARRFGAEKMKRSRERELLGVPGMDGGSSPAINPPPEKRRKKEKSSDVSARNSPAPPIERLNIRLDDKQKDLRKAESSISPPVRKEKEERRIKEEAASPSDHPKEKKKKENKLLDFVRDKQRPSPAPSPSVVEKLKREEKKKDSRGSASPSTSVSALERLKKDQRKGDKVGSPSSDVEKRKKEKNGLPPAPSEKEKRKEKEADRQQQRVTPPEKKEREKDIFDRLPGFAVEKKKPEKERVRESISLADTSASKREKERMREKDRDRPSKDSSSLLSVRQPPPSSLERERERERERRKELSVPLSISPPPQLLPLESGPSSASSRGGISPPMLVAVGNVSSIPSLLTSSFPPPSQLLAAACSSSNGMQLQQPSPCGSQGGRETPSEKVSSVSPALRNEETASSGGSSACSHSSGERREQKRIPKLARAEALNAPLCSVDASTVRRRIDSITDPDIIFEVALLLLDLDPSSSISSSKNAPPSLSYDLSNLDQKDLLRLESILNGS